MAPRIRNITNTILSESCYHITGSPDILFLGEKPTVNDAGFVVGIITCIVVAVLGFAVEWY